MLPFCGYNMGIRGHGLEVSKALKRHRKFSRELVSYDEGGSSMTGIRDNLRCSGSELALPWKVTPIAIPLRSINATDWAERQPDLHPAQVDAAEWVEAVAGGRLPRVSGRHAQAVWDEHGDSPAGLTMADDHFSLF
jgi:hypothetical protein